MSDQPKTHVEIRRSQANQDTLHKSDLIGGNFKGTDTSTVEAAINAL